MKVIKAINKHQILLFIAIWIISIIAIYILDTLLPTRIFETIANKHENRIYFSIPGTGGDIGHYKPNHELWQKLQPETAVIMGETAILGRYFFLKKVPQEELECRKKRMAELHQKAVAHEQQKKFGAAVSMYSNLCSQNFHVNESQENPCKASKRINKKLIKIEKQVTNLLEQYRYKNGKYPESLSEILKELPPPSLEIATGFTYCKKIHPNERTSKCSNGSISYSNEEAFILTNRHIAMQYFDLKTRSRPAPEERCLKSQT